MSEHLAIKVRNVSKKYSLRHPMTDADGLVTQEHWALKDVSFDVKKGESVGIIGPNGSGKSTLLKILSGITNPTSGEVEIFGKVASILDVGAGFHPELSGKENVFLNAQLLGFSKEEIKEKLKAIIEFSGIGNFIEEPVKNYSNGMYLRLAFSILVHLDFDIYLFDEVMSVGDAAFQIRVNSFLERKQKERTSTMVLVSHHLSAIQNWCSSVLLLSDGMMSQYKNHEIIENYVIDSYNQSANQLPLNEIKFSNNEFTDFEYYNLESVSAVNRQTNVTELFFSAKLLVKKKAQIDISFGIENLLGNELFYITTLIQKDILIGDITPHKKIEVVATIPSSILKQGKFVLSITMIVNGKPIFTRLKACCFDVISPTLLENKLIDLRANIPLIDAKWSIKQHTNG